MNRPYRLTKWRGEFLTLGTFATFSDALVAFALCDDANKQLRNDDLCDAETSGLTDEQLDAVFELPGDRAATLVELAKALNIARAA